MYRETFYQIWTFVIFYSSFVFFSDSRELAKNFNICGYLGIKLNCAIWTGFMIFVQVEEHAGRVSGRDEVDGPHRGQRHPRQP